MKTRMLCACLTLALLLPEVGRAQSGGWSLDEDYDCFVADPRPEPAPIVIDSRYLEPLFRIPERARENKGAASSAASRRSSIFIDANAALNDQCPGVRGESDHYYLEQFYPGHNPAYCCANEPATSRAVAEDQAGPEVCPCLDTCCASFCEVVSKILQTLSSTEGEDAESVEAEQLDVAPTEVQTAVEAEALQVMPHEVSGPEDGVEATAEQFRQVRHLYKIAGRCLRNGDIDMALNCYQEIVRICPHCRHGRSAQTWVARIKRTQGSSPPRLDAGADEQGSASDRELLEHLLLRAEQLRHQSQEPPVCPFHKDGSTKEPNAVKTDSPKDDDESMSEEEMQNLLDATELLETQLDGDEDVLVSAQEQFTGSVMTGAAVSSSSGLTGSISIAGSSDDEMRVLSVDPQPSDLVVDEEESEPAAGDVSSMQREIAELARALLGAGSVDLTTDAWGNEATLTVDGVTYAFKRNKLGVLELVSPRPDAKP